MIKCPVCGKYEFEQDSDFDVCEICGWENDGVQLDDPDYAGGANWVSLNRAIENYKSIGKIMSRQDEKEQSDFYAAHIASDGTWIP